MSESGSSFALIPHEVLATGNGYAIAVYATIARHANREARSWPSITLIADTTGWSRPTVIKAIAFLEDAGLIVKHYRHHKNGNQSNEYLLPLHYKGAKMDPGPLKSPPAKFDEVVNDVDLGSDPESMTLTLAPTVNDVDHAKNATVNDVDYPQLTTLTTHSKPRLPEQYRENNNDQSETTRKRSSGAKTSKGDPRVNEMKRAFCEAAGIPDVTDHGIVGRQAKQLISAGYTPGDIPQIVSWLRSQSWMTGGFDFGTVLKFADRWRASQVTSQQQVRRFVV